MDWSPSRRRLLRGTVAASGVAALGSVGASAGPDATHATDDDGFAVRSTEATTDAEDGFALDWAAEHVQENSTRVEAVTPAIDGDGILVVGDTDKGEPLRNSRVWLGKFDADGVAWTETLRADGVGGFETLVVEDDRYVVAWADETDDGYQGKVTVVQPSGDVTDETELDTTYTFFEGFLKTDAGYALVTDGGGFYLLDDSFAVTARERPREPEGWRAGADVEALAAVEDGFVVAGTVLNDDFDKSTWVYKVSRGDASVQWNRRYTYDTEFKPNAAVGNADGSVTLVGKHIAEDLRPFAMRVGPGGEMQWRTVLDETGGTAFRDLLHHGDGVRAVGRLGDGPGMATIGPAGSVGSTWAYEAFSGLRGAASLAAYGDGRYAFGGNLNPSDDDDVDNKAWVGRIQPNDPPTPSVSVEPSDPNATEPVTFDASETTDPDNEVESYEWNLDDDSYAEEAGETLTTTFESPGEYEVEFRATDEQGAVATRVVSVTVGENTAPTAELAVEAPSTPRPGDEVTVRATNVSDAETSVASVSWTVDGEAVDATGREIAVSFDAAGEHAVAATLADTGGKTTTVEATVTVAEPTATPTPTPTATAADAAGTGGDTGGGRGNDGEAGASGESPVPGFGAGAAATAVSAVAALARWFGDDGA